MSWTIGSSRDALKSGEKWTAHIIAANITQAVTGCAMNRTNRECRTGRSQRRRVRGEASRSRSVIGAARARSGAATSISSTCWTMCTEKSVVSYRPIPDSRATASANMPARNAAVRRRGTGLPGCAASTRRTAHSHHTIVAAIPSVGSGSKVQPRRSDAGVGGSLGIGP